MTEDTFGRFTGSDRTGALVMLLRRLGLIVCCILLFRSIAGERTATGDDRGVKQAQPLVVTKDEEVPAEKPAEKDGARDAATKGEPQNEKPGSDEKPAKVAGEPVDLEAVAAPLQALFGGIFAPAAPMAVVNMVDINVQNNAMIQQFRQQLQPKLAAELDFARLVCSDLPEETRPKVRAAADAGLLQAAKQKANQNGAQVQMNIVGRRTANSEPGKLIRDAITKSLKEHSTEELVARYSAEADKRAEKARRVTVLSVVARLDGQLCLTAEQREKITSSITSKWQDSWEKWLEMTRVYGDRYYPQVPDQCVVPHLNSEQKSVWNGLQKVDFEWWSGEQGPNPDADGWWGWERPQDAAEPAMGGRRVRVLRQQ